MSVVGKICVTESFHRIDCSRRATNGYKIQYYNWIIDVVSRILDSKQAAKVPCRNIYTWRMPALNIFLLF